MKRKVLILIVLAVVAAISLWAVYRYVYNKPHRDYASESAAHTLTADSLYRVYSSSAGVADSLYTGKVIVVSGVPEKFEKIDTLTVAVFVMDEGDFGPQGVRCTFTGKLPEEAYRPGNLLNIKGYCTGYNGEDVILESCVPVPSI